MTSQDLVHMFKWNHRALMVNLEDVDPAASETAPPQGGNSLNWIVGHIVFSRNMILRMLNQPTVLTPEESMPYRRGVNPAECLSLTPLPRLIEALQQSQSRLIAALGTLTEEQLLATARMDPDKDPGQPLNDYLRFLHFHEAYHVGQVGLLRRWLGLPGAI